MSKRRVVVTGLGIISPVGLSIKESWDNIVAGKSGISEITRFDVSLFSSRFGGTIKDFEVTDYITKKDVKKMDPFIHYGIAAGVQAVKDAGLNDLDSCGVNPERVGVAIGSGIGGISSIEQTYDSFLKKGPKRISPFFVPQTIINMISGNLSIMYGFQGPNIAIVTACTTGTHNIGEAARIIAYDDADIMIAGGAEMATSPCSLGGFAAARALSTRNDAPEQASRPWDKDRDGFVLGDGAGVVVLEEYEHAIKRGATIYAELSGFGMSGDAYHMTQPSKGGEGAKRCMLNALRDAGTNPDQVDYVNAHGTSTPAGDLAETQALKSAFGDHAYKTAISSTKSMIGHLLGAAGGVEAIFSILAIRDQIAPPTINIENQDPECDLDFVPGEARNMKIDVAVSNSFGFGGTNGTLVFAKI